MTGAFPMTPGKKKAYPMLRQKAGPNRRRLAMWQVTVAWQRGYGEAGSRLCAKTAQDS